MPRDESQAEQGQAAVVSQKPTCGFFIERAEAIELESARVVGEMFGMFRGDFGQRVEVEVAGVAAEVCGGSGRDQRGTVELQAANMFAQGAGQFAANGFDAIEPQGAPLAAELFGSGESEDRHVIEVDVIELGKGFRMPAGEHVARGVGPQLEVVRVCKLSEINPVVR